MPKGGIATPKDKQILEQMNQKAVKVVLEPKERNKSPERRSGPIDDEPRQSSIHFSSGHDRPSEEAPRSSRPPQRQERQPERQERPERQPERQRQARQVEVARYPPAASAHRVDPPEYGYEFTRDNYNRERHSKAPVAKETVEAAPFIQTFHNEPQRAAYSATRPK